jgi:hypothetical protein
MLNFRALKRVHLAAFTIICLLEAAASAFNIVGRMRAKTILFRFQRGSDLRAVVPPDLFAPTCSRRDTFAAALVSSVIIFSSNEACANTSNDNTAATSPKEINPKHPTDNIIPSLTIPLRYEPSLSAYIISYRVGKSKFGAIIDTGSPFLVVPKTSCRPDYLWGCYRPEESREAVGLKPTRERFDGNEGWVEWREGSFSFLLDDGAAASSSAITNTELALTSLGLLFPKLSSMTFGVISETLMDGPGGIFLGLVKDTDSWIRPSFLGQSQVAAFSVDLRKRDGMQQSLTLYGGGYDLGNQSIQASSEASDKFSINYFGSLKVKDHIPLTNELNKKYGDPTIHYVAIASSINVNNVTLASTSRKDGKLYVIFDTGCSGMTISPELFDKQYSLARSQKAKNVWDRVEVEFETASGEQVTLSAKRPIATPLVSDKPWGKRLDGHLIVLGLAFLDDLKMSIDVDKARIWFEV